MSLSGTVPAARLKKPSWKDPRLLVGILLVLASVASVVAIVSGADKTTEVYAARDTLVVGQRVTAESFSRVRVRLGELQETYYAPGAQIPPNTVAVRMVPKGELVARSSLGKVDALDRKPAALTISDPLPKEVAVGSRVDVWVSMPDAGNGYAKPVLMLPGAEVAELSSSSTALGATKSTQLQVLATAAQMPKILGAIANKAKVAVVWNPGGGK